MKNHDQEIDAPKEVPVAAQRNNLTGEEVKDFGLGVGKDVIKQTLVWTVAGGLTRLLRDFFKIKS
jgi:hypothetical protein